MLMAVSDTLMAGRAGTYDLAAVALGSQLWIPITLIIFGVSLALAPVISQLNGAKEYHLVESYLFQNLYTTLLVCLACVIPILLIPTLLDFIITEKEFKILTQNYIFYIFWSLPGMAIFMVIRNFCEGFGDTKPALIIGIIGLLVNIPTNFIFIHGKLGFEIYGGSGAGIASSLVYTTMAFSFLIYLYYRPKYKSFLSINRIPIPNISTIKSFIRLGLPISLTLLFEVGFFTVISILISMMGPDALSAHQIALNISSVIYMIPLSLSMALTLRVSYSLGSRQYNDITTSYKVALFLGLVFASINGLIMWHFGHFLSLFYTQDSGIVALAALLLKWAALFTLFDTFQALSLGALRGLKDTKKPMFITFFSYWPIGLSLGFILAETSFFTEPRGAEGYWIGFIFGLSLAALILTIRFIKMIRKQSYLKGT